jgi:hypothetical protein
VVTIRTTFALVAAVFCLSGLLAASASAQRAPEGPGQPVATGILFEGEEAPGGQESHGVIHCQAYVEAVFLSGLTYPPGTYPGVIVTNRNGTHSAGPPNKPCPAA